MNIFICVLQFIYFWKFSNNFFNIFNIRLVYKPAIHGLFFLIFVVCKQLTVFFIKNTDGWIRT